MITEAVIRNNDISNNIEDRLLCLDIPKNVFTFLYKGERFLRQRVEQINVNNEIKKRRIDFSMLDILSNFGKISKIIKIQNKKEIKIIIRLENK